MRGTLYQFVQAAVEGEAAHVNEGEPVVLKPVGRIVVEELVGTEGRNILQNAVFPTDVVRNLPDAFRFADDDVVGLACAKAFHDGKHLGNQCALVVQRIGNPVEHVEKEEVVATAQQFVYGRRESRVKVAGMDF